MLTQEERANMEAALCTAKGRKEIIAQTYDSAISEDNWQNVPTPYDIAGEMIDLVPDATHYAVLFSIEFLEVLVKERGVDPSRIAFFADTDREMKMARHPQMYGVHAFRLYKNRILTSVGFDSDELALEVNQGIKSIWGEGDMKFNKLAVVMNPPYQMQANEGKDRIKGSQERSIPIYHRFVETVIDNLPVNFVVSINPSRWFMGGMWIEDFKKRMMQDRSVKEMRHFSGHRDVFPSVSIPGGVNYWIWSKDHDGSCNFNGVSRDLNEFDVVVADNIVVPIIRKIASFSNKWISSKCLSQVPFGIRSNFSDWSDSGTKCYTVGQKIKCINDNKFTDTNSIVHKWKVAIREADGAAQNENELGAKRVVSNIFIMEPGSICTATYVVVNHFDKESDAKNFAQYVKTKFFRFMLGIRVNTQHINKEKFAFVPDLGDYSSPWTDEELYDKFKLTRQERAYIESKIKPLKGD